MCQVPAEATVMGHFRMSCFGCESWAPLSHIASGAFRRFVWHRTASGRSGYSLQRRRVWRAVGRGASSSRTGPSAPCLDGRDLHRAHGRTLPPAARPLTLLGRRSLAP
jgi:hypothetical protein